MELLSTEAGICVGTPRFSPRKVGFNSVSLSDLHPQRPPHRERPGSSGWGQSALMSLPRWGGDRLLSLWSQEDLGSNPAPAMAGCVTLTLSILLCQRDIKKKKKDLASLEPGLKTPVRGQLPSPTSKRLFTASPPPQPLSSHAPVCPLP